MKKMVPVMISCLLFLAACGNSNNDQSGHSDSDQLAEESLEPLEVEILTESDAFQPGKEGTIEIKVTKGNEPVSDADDVQFEIWKDGNKDASAMYEPENEGEGIYALSHTFKEKGIYQVITHVTARGSHTMPQKEFNVGNVEASSEDGKNDEHDKKNGVMMMLMKPDKPVQAKREVTLLAHIEKDGKLFHDASVRLEIWKEDREKHHFVETEENEEGMYEAKTTFKESGKYNVKIHVKKDDLHTHEVATIQVK